MESNEALYNGDRITTSTTDRLTLEQKLQLLDWHPLFTSRCPICEIPIRETTPRRVHWECGVCGWGEESI